MLDLFAGIGGFSLAAQWLGIQTTQFVENNPFCQQVLSKNFPEISIWSDICDYHPTPGQFDLYTIGFPCQGNSCANHKGLGLEDERSGLWFEALRAIQEGQPRFVVVENTPPTVNRNWLEPVLEGLDQAGFDAEWEIVSASEVGAPHLRERLFVVAYSHSWRLSEKSQEQEQRGRIEPCGGNQNFSEWDGFCLPDGTSEWDSWRQDEEITNSGCNGLQGKSQVEVIARGATSSRSPQAPSSAHSSECRPQEWSQKATPGRTDPTSEIATHSCQTRWNNQRASERGILAQSATATQHRKQTGGQPGSLGMDDGLPAWLYGITFSGWWKDNPAPMNAGVAPRSVPHRGDRIQACGNSVSPQVAEIPLRRVLQLMEASN